MFTSPHGIHHPRNRAAGASYAQLSEDDEELENLRQLTPRDFVISEEDAAHVSLRRSYSLTLCSAWVPRALTSTFLAGDDVTAFSSGSVARCNPCCCPTLSFRNQDKTLGIYKVWIVRPLGSHRLRLAKLGRQVDLRRCCRSQAHQAKRPFYETGPNGLAHSQAAMGAPATP